MFQPRLGEEKILFIRVIYPDEDTIILTDERAPLHAAALKTILETNSYGKYTVDIDITPILMMPQPLSFYSLDNNLSFVRVRADAAVIAKEAGYNLSDYDREGIFTAKVWPHEFLGVGGINKRTFYSLLDNPSLSAHELGHTFDWRHANFWRVTSEDPLDEDGSVIEYGDRFDIMGNALDPHHFNPWYKTRVGWIPKENAPTVQESGVYTILALENEPLEGPNITAFSGLRIRKSLEIDYLIFYRSKEEFANEGAMIMQAVPRNSSHSLLLDMTPFSQPMLQDYKDAALKVGQTFVDTAAGIQVTLLDKNPDSMHLEIVVPGIPIPRLPVINIESPPFSQGLVSGTVDYIATAFDPDAGSENGAGIDTVLFVLGYPEGDDPFGEGTIFIPMIEHVFTSPPYLLQVDTKILPDESYRLRVFAKSNDNKLNLGVLNHLIDNTGPSNTTTSVTDEQADLMSNVQIFQNYPNPFSHSTSIEYLIKSKSNVELNVYDLLGRKITTLVKEHQTPKTYTVHWNRMDSNLRQVQPGYYIYQLKTGVDYVAKGMLIVD